MPILVLYKIFYDVAELVARRPDHRYSPSQTEYDDGNRSEDQYVNKGPMRVWKRFFLFPVNREISFFFSILLYVVSAIWFWYENEEDHYTLRQALVTNTKVAAAVAGVNDLNKDKDHSASNASLYPRVINVVMSCGFLSFLFANARYQQLLAHFNTISCFNRDLYKNFKRNPMFVFNMLVVNLLFLFGSSFKIYIISNGKKIYYDSTMSQIESSATGIGNFV